MNELSAGLFRGILVLISTTAYYYVLPGSAVAGELRKARLSEQSTAVLGGRLLVRMPQGARVEARPFDIMSAPESEEHETRVIFDAGQERLVLMAGESFALAGDNFEKDVRDWLAKWKGNYRIEPIQLPTKGLKTIFVIPLSAPDHTRSDDATFVEGVFVESHDRTIQSLDVYVNSAAEQDLEGCRAVARQILLSVARGEKKLKLTAGERRLSTISKDLEISVTVPKNMTATRKDGPDFLVHRLIAVGRLGADAGSIGIYVGNHPDFHPGAKISDGMIFGKKVEWHSSQQGEGLEALCELPTPENVSLFAHVWVHASDDARLRELKQVAETMKLIKRTANK